MKWLKVFPEHRNTGRGNEAPREQEETGRQKETPRE